MSSNDPTWRPAESAEQDLIEQVKDAMRPFDHLIQVDVQPAYHIGGWPTVTATLQFELAANAPVTTFFFDLIRTVELLGKAIPRRRYIDRVTADVVSRLRESANSIERAWLYDEKHEQMED